MKNKFALLALLGLFVVVSYNVYAQDTDTMEYVTEEFVEETTTETAPAEETTKEVASTEEASASFHQVIKQKFIDDMTRPLPTDR